MDMRTSSVSCCKGMSLQTHPLFLCTVINPELGLWRHAHLLGWL